MSDDLVAFLRARLAADEQWALAASAPYRYADGPPPVPRDGVHWEWVTGDDWHPVQPDPVVSEYVADGNPVWLATREEWPVTTPLTDDETHTRRMRRTYNYEAQEFDAAAAGHIARHDPARVLREVEAKRRILDHWEDPDEVEHLPDGAQDGRDPDERDLQVAVASEVDYIVRLLALSYDQHPDYREEWRPT